MATTNGLQAPSTNGFHEPKFTSEHQLILLNSDEIRSKNREQLIEKLERVIQEKNASISKLEERELYLEDTLKKRNIEFRALEEQLRQFEEKTRTFEQLHQLQVQTFEKTIRDCQIENERLCEQTEDLTKQLREKSDFEVINHEKILSFDRITADTQLWRQKLDSYKSTIEQREETISNLKREINELQRRKQTNGDVDENALRVQIVTLQTTVRERDNEIEHLKLTLRRVRDTLGQGQSTRWRSTEDLNRNQSRLSRSSSRKKRRTSPPVRDQSTSPSLDVEYLKKKIHTLTDRLNNVQQLLVKRDDQISTLKKVHDKRWLRLKHLQKQYRSVKDELQSYTDDETLPRNAKNDFLYRKARTGCSVCNDQRRRKQIGPTRRMLRHEDDDNVWNEVTKLRRDNARVINENVSLNEKIDLQEVEINEQSIVIDELRNEIQRLNNHDEQRRVRNASPLTTKSTDDQQRVIEELDKKLYELETERTCLVFEHERLKTNLDLCIDEKQHLIQQRTQTTNEVKKLKLRILALQDQVHKFKRNSLSTTKKPVSTTKKRVVKKKSKKSCLEVLLDQDSTFIDDLQDRSSVLYRVSTARSDRRRRRSPPSPQRRRPCSLCDYHTESSLMKRKIRPTVPKKRINQNLKKNFSTKSRLGNSFLHDSYSHYARKPLSTKKPPTRIATMRKRIEQLEMDLADAKDESEQLNQRLSTTLSRVTILKITNQRLITECDKLKRAQPPLLVPDIRRPNSASSDSSESVDSLYARLKNTSLDAAQQRKLNKTLQTDNETLTKNLQSLTDKLTHTERDIASKRTLIENYKSKLSELEVNGTRPSDKSMSENDEDRLKSLTETMEKLRIALDSHKNRLQAVTREKQILETRYGQLVEEHQKLKTRYEDIQTKTRSSDSQLRQYRSNQDQLNQELMTSRRISDQQLTSLNTKTQDALNKITIELDRTQRRLNEYERFTQGLLHEMVRRSVQLNDTLKRAREHQKQRESFSMTLPGYDTAMHTASRILNLTQDDLDDIMSTTDDSIQGHTKHESVDKNERIRQKVSKLLISQEEFAGKLLKIFSKKLDEIQAADRDLAVIRNP